MPTLPALAEALSGRYRIVRELGAGGMATVFLAEDIRHRRNVAVKVLHPELSAVLGGERFLKEIELTANLQHPHILPLFDSGEAAGQLYYVMPFVEGETLRSRLERETQLPIGDAIQIAREVADALQYAHERGVIHRDIKPENVLLQGGHALVADFGIALAVQHAGGTRMTQTGLSLGTPQYMAPEQAMGDRAVDARADIYALGAVVYETLVGEPPFTGPTSQAIVAKLLTERPAPIARARETVPHAVDDAVMRALAKLPADRWPSALEFARAISESGGETRAPPAVAGPTPGRGAAGLRWRLVAVVALVAAAAGAGVMRLLDRNDVRGLASGPTFTTLIPPPGERWLRDGQGFALSPDGRTMAVVSMASPNDPGRLALRRLSGVGQEVLRGTEGARFPFWSPDGASLGFFAGGVLKRVEVVGGGVQTLCPAPLPRGGAWGKGGDILFGATSRSTAHVRADGGECRSLDFRLNGEPVIGGRPWFLDDGRHFVIANIRGHLLGELGQPELTLLAPALATLGQVASPDYLLFSNEQSEFFAQRIDARAGALVGDRLRILDSVTSPEGMAAMSASAAGSLLAVGPGEGWSRTLLIAGRGGGTVDSIPLSEDLWTFRYSRNGARLAVSGNGVWLYDVRQRTMRKMPVPKAAETMIWRAGIWSPQDSAIAFGGFISATGSALVSPATERWTIPWLPSPVPGKTASLVDWSPDGEHLLFEVRPTLEMPNGDIVVQAVKDRKVRSLIADGTGGEDPRFSPDGRFVAYVSTAIGTPQVYLTPFPGPGPAVRVTPDAGQYPRWRSDSRELYFGSADRSIMAVAVREDGTTGPPTLALSSETIRGAYEHLGFAASPDGQHFATIIQKGSGNGIVLIDGWQQLLKRR